MGIIQGMLEETALTKSHSFLLPRAEKVYFLPKHLTVESNVSGWKQSKTSCCLSWTLILPSQLPNIWRVVCSAGVKFVCVRSEPEQKDHKFSGNKKVEECYLCLHAKVYKIQITTIVNVLRPRTCSPSSISKRQRKSALLELLLYPSFYVILMLPCLKSKAQHLTGTQGSNAMLRLPC